MQGLGRKKDYNYNYISDEESWGIPVPQERVSWCKEQWHSVSSVQPECSQWRRWWEQEDASQWPPPPWDQHHTPCSPHQGVDLEGGGGTIHVCMEIMEKLREFQKMSINEKFATSHENYTSILYQFHCNCKLYSQCTVTLYTHSPASFITSASRWAVREVISLGLHTTVQPAPMAGAILKERR